MNPKLPKLLLFLFIIVLSCQTSHKKSENQIVTFDLTVLPKTSSVKLSDLGFNQIEYIPLETTDKSLIPGWFNMSNIGARLLFGTDYFIIKHFTTVLKFKNSGSFVAKIGTEGRGPNEFQVVHDVEVDEKGNIYMVDGWKRKIFVYSENGDFIKTISFPLDRAVEFRFVEGMFLCYSQNNMGNVEDSFNLIDTTGEIVKKFPNRYPFKKHPTDAYGFSHEVLFYRYDNMLFKKEVYSDTISSYDNFEFKPHLVIKVGDRLITPKARSESLALDLSKNYISPRNLFEFGDYIYYEFTYKFDFSNTLIYSFIGSTKSDFQALFDPGEGIINDLDGGPNILPLTARDDKSIIGLIEPLQLKAHVASAAFINSKPKYPQKKKDLETLAASLKETDNPVLVVVTLKE